MSHPTYKKADKTACDAFKRPFYFGRKAVLKSKTNNGVNFETTVEQVGGDMKGAFQASYKDKSGLEIKKMEVTTDHVFNGEMYLSNVVDNCKFSLNSTLKEFPEITDGEKTEIGLQYNHEYFTLIANCDPITAYANVNGIVGYEGFRVGGTAKFSMDAEKKPKVDNYDAFVGYKGDGYTVGCKTSKTLSNACVTVEHNYAKDTDLFVKLDYDVAKGKTDKLNAVNIAFAMQHQVDADTQFNLMCDKAAFVTAAYKQKIRPTVELTASAQVNLNVRTEEGPSDTKFGMAFNFGDL